MKQILIEARDRVYQKVQMWVLQETIAQIKNRFDMYFYYFDELFKKSQNSLTRVLTESLVGVFLINSLLKTLGLAGG